MCSGSTAHGEILPERPSGLDVKQLPNTQDAFWPIPGLISCAGETGSVGITHHARATQVAGLKSSQYCCMCQVV